MLLAGRLLDIGYEWLLTLPLSLLVLNLLTAVVINPSFRRQPALLTFHLALLTLVLLVALGRLTYYTAQIEVTAGGTYSGDTVNHQVGYWHQEQLSQLSFQLDDFNINYVPHDGTIQRGATRAFVRWIDRQGHTRQGIIGDQHPLVLYSYRIYTTHNKGFAPVFIWQPNEGLPREGAIHLPSYPANEHKQALSWNLPGTAHQIWTQLQFDEVILGLDRPTQFRAPEEHQLIVRDAQYRYTLHPGDSIELSDGRLTYKGLRTWMGFAVFYDWTIPWLFSAGIIAVLSLGLHYWHRCAAKPWLPTNDKISPTETSVI
jgi:cytochrome c biogenesis protein